MSAETPTLASYVWGHDQTVTKAHNVRTLQNSVPYLKPHLDRLSSLSQDQSEPSHFTLLDIGCGPGSITRSIARTYPHARVLGIDPSAKVIEEAKAELEKEEPPLKNISFAVSEAGNLDTLQVSGFDGFIDGVFDVVHAHQVLQHVTDPLAVLKSMKAAAKPQGGLVAVREADWGMMTVHPAIPAVTTFLHLWTRVARDDGCDPDVGRKLVGLALQAGFTRDNIEATLGNWLHSTPDERKWWADTYNDRFHDQSELANKASAKGWINGSEDVETMRAGWRQWAEAEDGWYALPCPQIVARRDDAPNYHSI